MPSHSSLRPLLAALTMPLLAAGVPAIQLGADVDRDGIVDFEGDDDREEQWTRTRGALFLHNCDDDDGDGVPDSADEVINGPDDLSDLAALRLAHEPDLPEPAVITLWVDDSTLSHVRVFVRVASDEWEVLPLNSSGNIDSEMLREGDIEMRIEATTFAGPTWNGHVNLSMTLVGPPIEAGRSLFLADAVRMRVAPWILLPNVARGSTLFVREFPERNEALLEDLRSVSRRADVEMFVISAEAPYPPNNIWLQDAMEIGYTQAGEEVMSAVLNSNRDKPLDMVARDFLLGPGVGWFTCGEFRREFGEGEGDDSWLDWFGNLEVTPPLPGSPLGRVYFGENPNGPEGAQMNPEVIALLDAQGIQGPAVALDVGFLLIQHVDEIVCFVPSADESHPLRALVPDVESMIALLDEWIEAGHGDVPILPTFKEGWTVASVRSDEALIEHNMTIHREDLVPLRRTLMDEFNLRSQDIIRVPALYEADGRSLFPNMVNSVVVNGHFLSPEPDGPVIGRQDQLEVTLRELLADLPLQVHFLDDEPYHRWCGNVHCATNVRRDPLIPRWWQAYGGE